MQIKKKKLHIKYVLNFIDVDQNKIIPTTFSLDLNTEFNQNPLSSFGGETCSNWAYAISPLFMYHVLYAKKKSHEEDKFPCLR